MVALNRLVLALAALYGADRTPGDRAARCGRGPDRAASAPKSCARGSCACCARRWRAGQRARAVTGALAGGLLGYGTAMAIGNFARELFAGRRAFGLARMVRK